MMPMQFVFNPTHGLAALTVGAQYAHVEDSFPPSYLITDLRKLFRIHYHHYPTLLDDEDILYWDMYVYLTL